MYSDEKYDCTNCQRNGFYKARNCRYFPEERGEKPAGAWEPGYLTPKGSYYTVEGNRIDECPVSYIPADCLETVAMVNRLKVAKDVSGASLAGPDLMQYDPKLVDALVVIETEERKQKWAEWECEKGERE